MLQPISEINFGLVNTISIPLDAIFLLFALVIFGGIIYLFNMFLDREYKDAMINMSENSILKIGEIDSEPQVSMPEAFEESIPGKFIGDQLARYKLFGLGALGFLALGGTSFFVLEKNQNLPAVLNTTYSEGLKPYSKENQSLSFDKMISSSKAYSNKNSYLNPALLTSNIPKTKVASQSEVSTFHF